MASGCRCARAASLVAGSPHGLATGRQIFDIGSDDRIWDVHSQDVSSAIMKKAVPSITDKNPAAVYLQKGLMGLNSKKSAQQRAAEAEGFRTEVLPDLMPFLKEQQRCSPAFYQTVLAPMIAGALNIEVSQLVL